MRIHPPAVIAALLLTVAVHAPAQTQDYTHYQGSWEGAFLFYVAQPDSGAQGAPEVHQGSLQIDSSGALRGSIPEAGCVLSGSSTDYVSPANASIDLLASGCRDTRFNGHFTGKLINNPALRYASLRLSSMRSLDAGTAQLSAVIRH